MAQGNAMTLRMEIMKAMMYNKTAWKYFMASGPTSNGTEHVMGLDVEVTQDYPLVSLVTMIAPSPDWFTGIMKRSLCNTTSGMWMDSMTVDMLSPWDAGTDNGTTFTAAVNLTTSPRGNIEQITKSSATDFMNVPDANIMTLGKLLFQRKNKPTMTQCSGEQTYKLTFEATWTMQNHPNGFPSNPHFSPLVVATHTYRYKFWSDMTRASPGVKLVAETGKL